MIRQPVQTAHRQNSIVLRPIRGGGTVTNRTSYEGMRLCGVNGIGMAANRNPMGQIAYDGDPGQWAHNLNAAANLSKRRTCGK